VSRQKHVALFVGLLMFAAACGGGGDSDQARNTPSRPGATGPNAQNSTPAQSADETPPVADDESTVTILVPNELATVVGALASEFGGLNPDVNVQLVTGESGDLIQRVKSGEEASIYIDDASVVDRLEEGSYQGEPGSFGSDLFRILVAKGNPKGVSGLGVFGNDPGTTSGMCAVEVPCGLLTAGILERGGVPGAPDRLLPSDLQLAELVAAGELDAAIVLRSAARTRFGQTAAVRIPPEHNQRIDYQIVQLRDASAASAFVDFVQNHEGARRMLTNRGYRSLYG